MFNFTINSAGLIILIIVLTACKEKITETSVLYSVSGTIKQGNMPLENARVAIDQKLNFTAYTDEYGNFMITGVPEGNHSLTVIKNYDDGSFSEKSAEISVYQDVVLDEIRLPNAVRLFTADSITASSAKLRWASSDAIDFREYKIFRHITSGLDEHTGTLVHVSTVRTDTVFTDKMLEAYQDYYYRVYVMNDFGRLGGSNLISFKTPNKNIIQNGDFEIVDYSSGLPAGWNYQTSYNKTPFSVVSEGTFSGQNSLMLEITDGLYNTHEFSQIISPEEFSAGDRYEVSFYMKHDSLIIPPYISVSLIYNNWEYCFIEWIIRGGGNSVDKSDWKRYSIPFSALNGIDIVNYTILFSVDTNYPSSGNQTYRIWYDDIRIERVP